MMYDSNNQFNFWESKFVLASFAVVALFLLFYSAKTLYIKYQIKGEISIMDEKIEISQAQAEESQKEAENLTDKSFMEKEARLKLDLKKPGEEVIMIINAANGKKEETITLEEKKDTAKESQNNLQKWIKKIF